MNKTHVNISIDDELRKKAKDKFINISAITEDAIKARLKVKEVDTSIDKCEFCSREQDKAYIERPGEIYHDGLTWLCPDEKWICSHCLTKKSIKNAHISRG